MRPLCHINSGTILNSVQNMFEIVYKKYNIMFLKTSQQTYLIKICPFNVYYHVLVANMLEYLNTAVCGVKTGVKC